MPSWIWYQDVEKRLDKLEGKSTFAAPHGSARGEDMAMLIRRLCRVIAKHDANNSVREQALDYLHRYNFGGSPMKGKAPNGELSDRTPKTNNDRTAT